MERLFTVAYLDARPADISPLKVLLEEDQTIDVQPCTRLEQLHEALLRDTPPDALLISLDSYEDPEVVISLLEALYDSKNPNRVTIPCVTISSDVLEGDQEARLQALHIPNHTLKNTPDEVQSFLTEVINDLYGTSRQPNSS